MGAMKKAAVKPSPATKKYWAFNEMDLEGEEPGDDSPEEAAEAEGSENGEVIVIYELVRVGTFKLSTKPVLTPIK